MSKESGPDYPYLGGITYTRILQAVNSKKLSAIYFPGGAVKFIPKTFSRADFVNDKALDRIVIENEKGEIVKQFIFNYKYLVGNQLLRFDSTYASAGSGLLYYWSTYLPEGEFDARLILESISEQDKDGNPLNNGTRFEYVHNLGLPGRESQSTDYWGYANGYSGDLFIVRQDGGMELAANSKDPNISYATQGSLKKISYPSGSSTYFSYGEKYAVFPDPSGSGYDQTTLPAGGLNVITMVTTDSLSNQKYSKTYTYSQGAATSRPYLERTLDIGAQTYKSISLNSYYPLTTTQGSTVGYGKVTEKELEYEIPQSDMIAKGKTEYYFTNPESDPDSVFHINQSTTYYPGMPIDDRDWRRGLLIEKKMFSNSSEAPEDYILKQQLTNEYGYVTTRLGKAFAGVLYEYAQNSANYTYRIIPYRLYKGRSELRNITVKKFELDTVATTFTSISYNKENYLPAVTTTFIPYEEAISETQSYASDFTNTPYQNFPSLPVESLKYRWGPAEFVLLSGQLIDYDSYGDVSSVSALNMDTAVISRTGFKYAHTSGGTVPNWVDDPPGLLLPDRRYYKRASFARQSNNGGSLKEKESVTGLKETYIWGYTRDHAQYPVAKIIGGNYNIASRFINQSLLDSAIYYSDARIRIELNKLRVNLPDAKITTYTYKPLVGITSETDANGKTIHYEYDSFGRLTMVKDNDYHILRQVCYNNGVPTEDCFEHYYYSNEKSGSFTQINCSGSPDGSVTYKVPKGAYSSTISQADADQKAQNDLQANGQAYANSFRVCPVYLNVEKSQSFTRNNCGTGSGDSIIYTVAAETYASIISQQNADQQALDDINMNGQGYANKHASCPDIFPYARLQLVNVYTDWYTNTTYVDVQVGFYEDQGCVTPYNVNNLTLYVDISSQFSDSSWNNLDPYLEFNCNGSSQIIMSNVIISGYDPDYHKTVTSRVFWLPPIGNYFNLNFN